MCRVDRLDSDVGVRGRIAGRQRTRVRIGLEGRITAGWRFAIQSRIQRRLRKHQRRRMGWRSVLSAVVRAMITGGGGRFGMLGFGEELVGHGDF